jgi:ribA/ribD-fused uncharacterized protein
MHPAPALMTRYVGIRMLVRPKMGIVARTCAAGIRPLVNSRGWVGSQCPKAFGAFGLGLLASYYAPSSGKECQILTCEAASPKVVLFNSANDLRNPYRAFSNHHLHSPPFEYVVPFGTMKGTIIFCEHANKALHCTKASIFGDKDNFDEIKAENDPVKCQQLGRRCKNFDQAVWNQHVKDVAFQMLLQKFGCEHSLRHLLLSTGDAVIAEASKNMLWGIGLREDDEKAESRENWPGQNLQGEALMHVRARLRRV